MRLVQLVARWSFGVSLVLASLAAAPAARAADDDPPPPSSDETREREFRFEIGFLGGWRGYAENNGLGRGKAQPTTYSPAEAPVGGARLTLNFNRWFAMEAEFDASKSHTRNDAADLGLYGYRGNLLLNLATGIVRPFLLAGYGATTLVSSNERVVANDTDGSLHAGGGIKILFGDRVGLRVEGRAYIPPEFAKDVIPTGEGAFGDPDWAVLGSLFFTMSEIITERHYHQEKVVVAAPPPPPPPPSDPDHDGIAGSADACPTEPEDGDGFQDQDGCPDPDNDGDGILDATDKCPNNAETRNGVEDDDGCPEEDTDGDGFLGSRDKCPDAPETKNNYKDDDGCPDEIPPAVKKFTGVIDGINFRTGSADILPGSYAILERAVAVLTEFPDVKMEISGHTDNVGRASRNQDLSQRRAESVRQFLVMRGVNPQRLIAVGYGPDRPIADNSTRSGRATNRRTEFKLVQ